MSVPEFSRLPALLSRLRPLALVAALFPCAATGAAAESVLAETNTASADPSTRPRIATLLPWVADAFHRIGRSELVVASVRSDFHVPLAGDVVDLGSSHSPSIERLADARPTVVVGDRDLHAELAPRLSVPDARVLLIRSRTVAATFDALIEVAALVDERSRMEEEVNRARAEIAAVSPRGGTSILPLFGAPGSFLAISGSTWFGDLLARTGFTNLAATASGEAMIPGYVQLSDETLAAFDPEFVVVVTHGDPVAVRSAFLQLFANRGLFRAATTAGRVHLVGPPLFTANPGLAIVDVARWMNALRPEPPAAP